MLEDLIIVGAGGFSGSAVEAVEAINRQEPRWNLLGFLDDEPAKHGLEFFGYRVLGATAETARYRDCRYVIGVASHRNRTVRQTIAERMELAQDRFATIVHPSASVSRAATLGVGCVILEGAVVNHGVSLGDFTLISELCSLGHDSVIANCVTMAAGVVVSGSTTIGEGVYLGAGSHIMQNLTIGNRALVGIGAVVVRDVPPRVTVFGNPARPLRGTRYASK